MRGLIPALAALVLGGAASAQVGPGDVLDAAAIDRATDCLMARVDDLSCLAGPDIPPGARNVAADIATGGAPVPLLTGFTEAGAVDLGTILFPWLANTNYQQALLNTDLGAVGLGDVMPRLPEAPDAATLTIREAHPQAFRSGRSFVNSVRHLPDGTQRIVALDEVNAGCRACAIVGVAITWLDYRHGALVEARHMGWRDAELLFDDPDALPAGEAVDIALLMRGYGSGEMAAFRADACLPAGDGLDDAAARALVAGELTILGAGC